MKKLLWMLLACLLLACGVALAECAICGGDGICDTCAGNGYLTMQAYGSDEQLKVACTAACDNGRCPDCAVSCDACGSDQKCDVCGGMGYLTMQAYGSDAEVKVACTGENCADGACAVCAVTQMVSEPKPEPTPAPSADDVKPASGGMAITHIGNDACEIDPNKSFGGKVSIAQGNTPQPTAAKKKTGTDLGALAKKLGALAEKMEITDSNPKSMEEGADELGWEENTDSYSAYRIKDFPEVNIKKDESKIQTGSTLTIEVFIGDDHRKYTINTTETYLLDALLEEGLVKGEKVSWGFNVTTVDGVKASYNRKGEYWSILEYVNGDYTSMMDSLANRKVRDGDRYAFTLMN